MIIFASCLEISDVGLASVSQAIEELEKLEDISLHFIKYYWELRGYI